MPSGLTLFQIGGMSLPFPRSELHDTYNNQTKGQNTDLYSSMNPLVLDTQYLQKERSLKYKALAFDLRNFNFEWADNYMRQVVGKPIPVIAYILHGIESKRFGCNCMCSIGKDCCGITFVQAIGIIKSVDGLNDRDWAKPRDFGFTLELVTPWRGLDLLKWRYGSGGLNSSVAPISIEEIIVKSTGIRTISKYGYAQESLPPNCSSFFKDCKVCNSSFAPIVFDDECNHLYDIQALKSRIHSGCCENENCCVGKVGNVIEAANRGVAYDVGLDSTYWNAPPLSMYIFRGVAGETISITTRGTDSLLIPITRRTIIDIETTNEILSNKNILVVQETDLVIVGDFQYYNGRELLKNSMIVRDGEVLDVQPIVSYPDYFPAMINPSGDAKVSAIGNFSSYDMAHYFRRW